MSLDYLQQKKKKEKQVKDSTICLLPYFPFPVLYCMYIFIHPFIYFCSARDQTLGLGYVRQILLSLFSPALFLF